MYIIIAFPEKNEGVLPHVLIQQNISVQPQEKHIPFIKIYTHIPLSTVICVSKYLYIFLIERKKKELFSPESHRGQQDNRLPLSVQVCIF